MAVQIFIDPGSYSWTNFGDVLMFEVALARLRAFWPDARIVVHTLADDSLLSLDHRAVPLDPVGSFAWSAAATAAGRSFDALRARRRRIPGLFLGAAAAALVLNGRNPRRAREYYDAIRQSDLVVVSGAGGLNDAFRSHALRLLETMELASDAGAVTALLGQGIGPMRDPRLRDRARMVLPKVDVITLREGRASVPLLRELGVSPERVEVTGDDAITRGFDPRPGNAGRALGVNLRVASYAGVGPDLQRTVGDVVRDAAQAYGRQLEAIPISLAPENNDVDAARAMIGAAARPVQGIPDLLRRVAGCRVVVSGSYHAALLGLSMGIPAVTIVASEYYGDKFRGLAEQFGCGCVVEFAGGAGFPARLRSAIDDAWREADSLRAGLLDAAAVQNTLGEDAYRRLFQRVEARRLARSAR